MSNSRNPLDSVLELVDGNNQRLSFCRKPGDTSGAFTSPCLNDDIGGDPYLQDSALDLQVPGTSNDALVFYARVFDWTGAARPDMTYRIDAQGILSPVVLSSPSFSFSFAATKGAPFTMPLSATGGISPISLSSVGSLPPGITLSSGGVLSGKPTTNGTYSFTITASDAGNPPEQVTVNSSMQVGDPVAITSSATFPDACAGQPYSFTPQATGGVAPLTWSFVSSRWVAINFDRGTGIFSGTTTVVGTFFGLLGVGDAAGSGVKQNVSLTVKQCS
jgi:hypothetical protein